MKIRRYFGHDCDSVNGFNNGYYIDDDYIEVNSDNVIYQLCISVLRERYDFKAKDINDIGSDTLCLELITGWYDEKGNALNELEFSERDNETDSYSYVYVSAELEV